VGFRFITSCDASKEKNIQDD
jgi:hypothetical protein